MAEHSAFDKLHVDESNKADLGGLLEQFNLPPAFIALVRKHQKAIYIVLGIVTVLVVTWALYGAHVEKKLAESSSALAVAQKLEGEERLQALEKVVGEYSGTGSAIWAKIEIGRYHMEKGEFSTALQHYLAIRSDIDTGNPLYHLVTFGIAQANEALDKFDEAVAEYETLKTVAGYESIGYTGTAGIFEVQGNLERAINEYEQYLGTLDGNISGNPERLYIDAKISALKAQM